MPVEQAEPAAPQIDQALGANLPGALPAQVNNSCCRNCVNLPAGAVDAQAPVNFLAVHEVTLVEHAGCGDHLAPDHHRRAEGVIHWKRLAPGVTLARVAPVERRVVQARRNGKQLDDKLDEAGELERAVLESPVAVGKLRADDSGGGQAQQCVVERPRRASNCLGVRVEEIDGARQVVAGWCAGRPAEPDALQGEVVASGEAQVGGAGDERHLRELLADGVGRAVSRGAVHHPNLGSGTVRVQVYGEGAQGVEGQIARVPRHDDDSEIGGHGILCTGSMGAPG